MSVARFLVLAQLDNAGAAQKGIVEIDRESGLCTVRPYRKQRSYTMPLNMVADMICKRIIFNELADERRAKKKVKRAPV